MFRKFLVWSTLMYIVVAEVKYLSSTYISSVPKLANQKLNIVTETVKDIKVLPQQDISDNELKSDSLNTSTKDANQDPLYSNGPFGFNGLSGGFPATIPGFPGQIFPGQGLPGVGFPPQGFTGQSFPPQFIPPGQVFPPPVLLPSQGFINPGLPVQGLYQGFSSQVFPSHGFSGPGFPFHYSNEALKEEKKDEDDDKKLRLRLASSSDTQYDAMNGGYLYHKPTIAF